MADIRTVFIDMERGADYAVESMLLQEDDGLDTAVILSLFTDRRAGVDDVVPGGSADKRGTWMDAYPDLPWDKMGSRLWLLARAKLLQENVIKAREYCEEALAWMVNTGVAKAVSVDTWIVRNHPIGVVGALIAITRPDGTTTRYQFDKLWSAV